MQDNELNRLTRAAILAALVCIATIVIPIPLPGGGYANAGDIVLLVAAYILGPGLGAAAAGIGSGVADLILGYSAYAPGTFVIKAADAAAAGALYMLLGKKIKSIPAMLVAGLAGEIVMVAGYFGYETLIMGNAAAAAVGAVPNMLQGAAGIVGSTVLLPIVKKAYDGMKKQGEVR